jgi:hypothetical protein
MQSIVPFSEAALLPRPDRDAECLNIPEHAVGACLV